MLFKAIRISETTEGKFERHIVQIGMDDLPAGELLIRVHYSSLNYKDALSATGHKGITRKYPHTPGIDAAGVVELSRDERFAAGDEVIITGYGLGMNTSGGFAEYIRVPAEWAVIKPREYSFAECMILGTAGFTAAMALYKLQLLGITPGMGPVVVTGSTGGVGSIALALLAKTGYETIAVTGKTDAKQYLEHIGASRIENRQFVDDKSGKPLLKSQWAAAIDTAGGNTLATLIRGCLPEGCIASIGMVTSPQLDITVYPFILNGVNLVGIGSAETSMEKRKMIWNKFSDEWNIKEKLAAIGKEATLEGVSSQYIDAILRGGIMGRIVIKI